jgi:uncharacterized protein YyaL (SSP411 family)
MSARAQFTNRLIDESSAYLKQHAHNPVDWHPWSPEAIESARRLDRPIFLSIGYSACHWCHVMEHESFEDPDVADILNTHFVSIKVDREERPDLDQIYMTAVQMMTGQGGWPMSMFLTPDLKPFYGGTYFPPDDRHGRPSFKRLLTAIAEAWRLRREEMIQSASQLSAAVGQAMRLEAAASELGPELLQRAAAAWRRNFDPSYGGFGAAPKFPHAVELRLLLRVYKRFGDEDALQMARVTLDHMARGGIFDHLGGGFHRYSTDAGWLVPHFEKMLYDNALLVSAYTEAFQATADPLYREVVEQTLGYVLREMTSPEGPFYSSQDADSDGEEGQFYVWSAAEIAESLGTALADPFMDVFGVIAEGNWEGHNILNRSKTLSQHARLRETTEAQLRTSIALARSKLYEVRAKRTWPGRDEKILTSWNGLMIGALALASRALEQPAYAEAAARAADFLLTRMRRPDGLLWRTHSAGSTPKLNAYLEDYAYLADGLISLYEATFEPRWIEAAADLTRVMIDQFWDPAQGGFFFTGRDHEELIARSKDPYESSTPSGNSMAVTTMLRLAKLTGRPDLFDKADATLKLFAGQLRLTPTASGQMLCALDYYLGPVAELALVGNAADRQLGEVLAMIFKKFRPNKVVAFKPTTDGADRAQSAVPLLAGKTSNGPLTTYICRDFACRAPVVGAEALAGALTD